MTKELMTWQELLSFEEFDDYSDEYGPNTQAVVNCFETLNHISWFATVGAETGENVEGIDTWGEALAPIMGGEGGRYDEAGHPIEPAEAAAKAAKTRGFAKPMKKAFNDVEKYVDYMGYIPAYFDKPQKEFMRKHMEAWLQNMLAEIITDSEVTYFREMLTWFENGHFPCGWAGEWPEGRLRVF